MTVRKLTLALLALGGVVWLAAIVSTPSVLHASRDDTRWNGVATLTYVVGAVICHQRPERSFHTAGIKWPVCSRCTGLYAGAAFALLLWPIVRRVSSSPACSETFKVD
ncbi:MAG: DUF2085 domain-containing protein [Acidobacteria bacterium]|nr:DUF2085 domain-containing protein [Acidobacteriota bacterium]